MVRVRARVSVRVRGRVRDRARVRVRHSTQAQNLVHAKHGPAAYRMTTPGAI